MTAVSFSSRFGADMQALKCPRCGDDDLHHIDTRIFFREKEDAVSRIVGVDKDGSLIIGKDGNCANPSDRRDGIRILFFCESCPETFDKPMSFVIYQHKGPTFFKWEHD